MNICDCLNIEIFKDEMCSYNVEFGLKTLQTRSTENVRVNIVNMSTNQIELRPLNE